MLKLVRLCLVAAVSAAVLAAVAAGAPPSRASYIVVLNPNAGPPASVAAELSNRWGGSVSHVYSHALQGFALTLPPQAITRLCTAACDRRLPQPRQDSGGCAPLSTASWPRFRR